jgi:hypothetical protein
VKGQSVHVHRRIEHKMYDTTRKTTPVNQYLRQNGWRIHE